MDADVVHIFWDHSNLFARAQDACDDRQGGGRDPGHRLDARLHFKKVLDFASAGRVIEKAVAVGSIPPGVVALWDRLRDANVKVGLQERGAETGKEQAVDEAIKLKMMNSVVDREQPAVAVLLSGDGDFLDAVERMLNKGWGVEVLSFSKGFAPRLKAIATGYSGRRREYIVLDDWYQQLVYLQGLDDTGILRPSEPLDLTGRPRV